MAQKKTLLLKRRVYFEICLEPAFQILEKWFESEPLKATLATDSCIGQINILQSMVDVSILMHKC